MKYINLFILMFALASCGGSSGGGGGSASGNGGSGNGTGALEDTLDMVYNVIAEADNELVEKLEFFDNDSMKLTRKDGSSEVLQSQTVEEGTETDAELVLSAVCPDSSSGDTLYADLRITESNGDFAALLGAVVWEGTCGGQSVSCVGMVVYDQDVADVDTIDPVQGFIFDLNGAGGCTPIQSRVESLLDSLFP